MSIPLPVSLDQRKNKWQSELFDCLKKPDPKTILMAWCLLPCLSSENNAILNNDENLLVCCYPGGSAGSRLRAMGIFALEGEPLTECVMAVCCPPCSEVQVRREIMKYLPDQKSTKCIVEIGASPEMAR